MSDFSWLKPDGGSAKPYKKALLLGGAGFIGVNLARRLAAAGYDLVCFDREPHPEWPTAARVITGDFFDLPADLIAEMDETLIFHLVSSCRPSSSTAEAANEINRDLAVTVRYLEATKGCAARWVFLSSGGTVYGPSQSPLIDETSLTAPICSYGVLKLAIERYFALYHTLYGTDFVVTRVANPYGPWQHPFKGQGVIAATLYKAIHKQRLEIWGDGTAVRDYIYIDDVADGIIAAATAGIGGEIYNVGAANGQSLNQLIEHIDKVLGLRLDVAYLPARSIDVPRNVLNPAKLIKDTGWRVRMPMEEGLKATHAWMLAHYG